MQKILCIEDEPQLRADIVSELREAGFDAFEAENGAKGHSAIMAHTPDLVLCDIMMPELSGLDLLEKVRKDPSVAGTPFVFMTAMAEKHHVLAGRRLGADDYLTKPIDFEIMVEIVRSRLASHHRATAHGFRLGASPCRPANTVGFLPQDPNLLIDPVTGLPNHHKFQFAIADWLPDSTPQNPLTVMLATVSRPLHEGTHKHTLDAHQFARRIAQRIENTIARFFDADDETSEPTIVARIREDVFGIALFGVDDQVAIECIAREVANAIAVPPEEGGESGTDASTRIGIFLADQTSVAAPVVLGKAEIALERAKNGQFVFYEDAWAARDDQDFRLSKELSRALRRDEFQIVYQPRFRPGDGETKSVEALVRWSHPDRGMLSPDHFIGVAEKTGMIARLGEWVLRRACAQIRTWQDGGLSDIAIAVNISSEHFSEPKFVSRVAEILRETRVAPAQIEIEITESSFISDPDQAARNLNALQQLGISVAIDDFGTGYANLAYLKTLPTNTLKIDRAFVAQILTDPFDAAIAEAIIDLCRIRGMHVIAEGVETEEQVEFLLGLGCDEFQGFIYSQPVPPAQVPKLLQDLTAMYAST